MRGCSLQMPLASGSSLSPVSIARGEVIAAGCLVPRPVPLRTVGLPCTCHFRPAAGPGAGDHTSGPAHGGAAPESLHRTRHSAAPAFSVAPALLGPGWALGLGHGQRCPRSALLHPHHLSKKQAGRRSLRGSGHSPLLSPPHRTGLSPGWGYLRSVKSLRAPGQGPFPAHMAGCGMVAGHVRGCSGPGDCEQGARSPHPRSAHPCALVLLVTLGHSTVHLSDRLGAPKLPLPSRQKEEGPQCPPVHAQTRAPALPPSVLPWNGSHSPASSWLNPLFHFI